MNKHNFFIFFSMILLSTLLAFQINSLNELKEVDELLCKEIKINNQTFEESILEWSKRKQSLFDFLYSNRNCITAENLNNCNKSEFEKQFPYLKYSKSKSQILQIAYLQEQFWEFRMAIKSYRHFGHTNELIVKSVKNDTLNKYEIEMLPIISLQIDSLLTRSNKLNRTIHNVPFETKYDVSEFTVKRVLDKSTHEYLN